MTNMIFPAFQCSAPEFNIEHVSRQNLHDTTFADYFDRQLAQGKIQGNDKFGIQPRKEKLESGNSEKIEKGSLVSDETPYTNITQQDQTVAGMLSQFMQDLQKTAEKKYDPGEWVAVLPDHIMLQKVADKAGMGEADMSFLLQQLEAQGGELNLSDFLNILGQHFQTIEDVPAITVPETELPFLETLLSKMGFSLEDINALGNKAVKNEGKLDLSVFLEGFQHVTDSKSQDTQFQVLQLSDWESEQLQNLLAQAGSRQGKLTALFPERYFGKISDGQPKEFALSFERLQDMLSKAIADINQNRPQPNLPGFLKELDNVFSHTQFADTGVGWTPVVQNSLTAVFREMQNAVELARKKITEEVGLENNGIEEELRSLQQAMPEEKTGTLAEYFSHTPSDADSDEFAQASSLYNTETNQKIHFSSTFSDANLNGFTQPPPLPGAETNLRPFQGATDSWQEAQSINSAQDSHVVTRFPRKLQFSEVNLNEFTQTPSLKDVVSNFSPFQVAADSLPDSLLTNSSQNSHVVTRSPQQLQAQVFQQISSAVMHGIRSDEHHLVLRLYPQELGEVKVDMLVKNEQISVTFNMENGRVKEMLESNMAQFRENMEQRGFSLGECSVSVGQQDDSGDEWRRFMMSGNEGAHKETPGDIPEDVLYLRGDRLQWEDRGDSLSLFV